MNRTLKKAMSILFAAVMLLCSASLAGFESSRLYALLTTKAYAETITSYEVGDIIEFGWYPQSEESDSNIIAYLNDAEGEWKSYRYYSGTEYPDGQMTYGDYMRYKDVVYGSNKYRGVVFDTYRPYSTVVISSTKTSEVVQDNNGYYMGKTYWFKYEPIKWRVLDPDTGMLMSETILDAQAFNNYYLENGIDEYGEGAAWGDSSKTYYSNNYAKSSLREWLNNDFYNTAFSTAQQSIIEHTELDNSAFNESFSVYASESTYDKIYLLSWNDVINTNYGFASSTDFDFEREAQGSDYAKCQGLSVDESENNLESSHWLLRTAGYRSFFSCGVGYNGDPFYIYGTCETRYGVRPGLKLNLNACISHSPGEWIIETESSCISKGEIIKKCTDCGETLIKEEITEKDHTEGLWEIAIIPTTEKEGKKIKKCTVCSTILEESIINKIIKDNEIVKFPSTTTISYVDSIILHVDAAKIPTGGYVEWTASNGNFDFEVSSDGLTCKITPKKSGDTTFTATIYDADGNPVLTDEQEMNSKAGFFDKIIAFFKKLFGLTKTHENVYKGIIG